VNDITLLLTQKRQWLLVMVKSGPKMCDCNACRVRQ